MNTPCWEVGGWTALVGGNATERIGRSRVYDDAKEVRDLAVAHGFFIKPIPMKTTHHTRIYELAITNRPFDSAIANQSLRLLEQSPRYRANRKSSQSRSGRRQV